MRPLTLVLLGTLAACGGKHPGSYQTAEATGGDESSAGLAAADELWEQRDDKAKLEQALAGYTAVLEDDPGNRHALTRATRGYYFLGDAHVHDDDEKIALWGQAIEYGARCLALNEDFAAKIQAGEKEKDAVAAATAADVPCLYWTATALGKWGKAQSLSKTLKHLPTVKAYIGKVEELDPEYFHYGPARYWGAYYAALPSFAGQDFDKSAEYFQASLSGAPDYLGTRVLRADFLAVPTDDVAQFDADLKAVAETDLEAVPEDIRPENKMEQEKARRLIEKRAELFSKKSLEAADGGDGE